VISWGSIAYGAALSAPAAAAAVALVLRERRPAVLVAAALAAGLGPLVWNAILRDTGGDGFFVDAPSTAAAALVLGLGPLRAATGRRVALVALVCGLAAFLVDVYLH
jgi:hypothetical protein